MLKRDWALIALVYLALAEVLSLAPVSDLSLCLIEPEHGQQSPDHDDKKYCPAFHMGAALVFERTDRFLEAHDKSVIGAFTIVLAISTIGLWLATNRLWSAGERQLTLAAETSAAQSRDMQASVAEAKKSADATLIAAQVSKASIRANLIIPNFSTGQHRPGGIVDGYSFTPNLENAGPTHAVNVRFVTSLQLMPIDAEYKFTMGDIPQASVIGPRTVVGAAGRLPMSVADAVLIWRNERKCLLWCRVEYDDIMGESHHIEICVRVGFNGDPREIRDDTELIAFAPYGTQNSVS
jgi:hypothetical protein